MNINEIFDEIALDADPQLLADPSVIREVGQRLRTQRRRRTTLAIVAVVAVLCVSITSALRLRHRDEPAPVDGIDGWQVSRTLSLPRWGILLRADGSLWVGDARDAALNPAGTAPAGRLLQIDPGTGQVVARIRGAVGGWPDVGDGAIWLCTAAGGLDVLTRVDLSTHEVTRFRTAPGNPLPHGIAVTRDGLWVANTDLDELTRLDPVTGSVTSQVDFGSDVKGDGPWLPIADRGTIWVTTDDGRVVGVASATGREVADVKLPLREARTVWWEHHVLYVAGSSGNVFAVDVSRQRHPTTHAVPGLTALMGLGDIEGLTSAGGSLWAVLVDSSELLRIDPVTFAVTGRISLPPIDSSSRIPAALAATGGSIWVRVEGKVLEISRTR